MSEFDEWENGESNAKKGVLTAAVGVVVGVVKIAAMISGHFEETRKVDEANDTIGKLGGKWIKTSEEKKQLSNAREVKEKYHSKGKV